MSESKGEYSLDDLRESVERLQGNPGFLMRLFETEFEAAEVVAWFECSPVERGEGIVRAKVSGEIERADQIADLMGFERFESDKITTINQVLYRPKSKEDTA